MSEKAEHILDIRKHLVKVARGQTPAERIFRGGLVINVFTGEVLPSDIAVSKGYIAYVGPKSDRCEGEDTQIIDVEDRYLSPGFLDAHLHIESSGLTPSRFAELMLSGGVTGVFFDPHEVANVLGLEGVKWMVNDLDNTPLHGFLTVPSCVPASTSKLETTGAKFGLKEIVESFELPGTVALGELMNYPGVLQGNPDVYSKLV